MSAHCPTHRIPMLTHTRTWCPACIGAAGGAKSSPAKTAAARRNARKLRGPRGPRRVTVTPPAAVLWYCAACGDEVHAPHEGVGGVPVTRGHVDQKLDTTCGRWGFRRAEERGTR